VLKSKKEAKSSLFVFQIYVNNPDPRALTKKIEYICIRSLAEHFFNALGLKVSRKGFVYDAEY